jgi:hypothetical protein
MCLCVCVTPLIMAKRGVANREGGMVLVFLSAHHHPSLATYSLPRSPSLPSSLLPPAGYP